MNENKYYLYKNEVESGFEFVLDTFLSFTKNWTYTEGWRRGPMVLLNYEMLIRLLASACSSFSVAISWKCRVNRVFGTNPVEENYYIERYAESLAETINILEFTNTIVKNSKVFYRGELFEMKDTKHFNMVLKHLEYLKQDISKNKNVNDIVNRNLLTFENPKDVVSIVDVIEYYDKCGLNNKYVWINHNLFDYIFHIIAHMVDITPHGISLTTKYLVLFCEKKEVVYAWDRLNQALMQFNESMNDSIGMVEIDENTKKDILEDVEIMFKNYQYCRDNCTDCTEMTHALNRIYCIIECLEIYSRWSGYNNHSYVVETIIKPMLALKKKYNIYSIPYV